jgi:protein-L-isoaspartate(D-aspartate) O-methyltransferase
MNLNDTRQYYAQEIRAVSNIQCAALVTALGKVPRERFLGPGPWQIVNADPWQIMPPNTGVGAGGSYRSTDDADPKHLYHNVLVAIDVSRKLNNGLPSALVWWLDCLGLRQGDRVLHVGCGTGYYSAIIAEVVGPTGEVISVEVDADIASRARDNLAYLKHVKVVCADGGEYDPGPADAVFVNAGATHPRSVWLDCLRPEGRLILPLTMTYDQVQSGTGLLLKVERAAGGFPTRFISPVMIFSCLGSRDAERNSRLGQALAGSVAFGSVQSLRRDKHDPDETCWLHDTDCCLSTMPSI